MRRLSLEPGILPAHSHWAIAAVLALTTVVGCAHSQPPARHVRPAEKSTGESPLAIELAKTRTLADIVAQLDDRRAIFVGETHNRYDHHLVQLEVVREAHRRTPKLAIGVEWFQQPFQTYLDDFIAGRIDEAELLSRSGYFQRWRFDYRLYRPILLFAREHKIPLVALNASQELTRQISESGIDALPAELRAQLPDQYDRSDSDYEQRLKSVFGSHPGASERDFDRFMDIQLTWDESMAQAAAEYLRAHPDYRMVILAGSGHVAYRSGIPNRLQRRLGGADGSQSAVILIGDSEWEIDSADYLVLSKPRQLPPAGLLGAFLDDSSPGGLKISGFSTDSPLEAAGVSKDDILLGIDDNPVPDFAALKIALIDRRPGDVVQVSFRHTDWLGREREKSASVTLQGRPTGHGHP
jgi:uncharacterized iron-regulated protein